MITPECKESILGHLHKELAIAYVQVNHVLEIVDISGDMGLFGFTGLRHGENITDKIECLVGIDVRNKLDIPMLLGPNGRSLNIHIFPSKNVSTIVFLDTQEQFLQKQSLQQVANENAILVSQLQEMTEKLMATKNELKNKNKKLEEVSLLQEHFLSNLSHEFRTPLSSILGYTNLLSQTLPDSEKIDKAEAERHLHAVNRSGLHLLSLVENLLDHGKYQSGEIVLHPKTILLTELFEDILLLFKPLAGKDVVFSVEHNLAEDVSISIDDSKLRQCLINVIGNALKFTEKGEVVVRVNLDDNVLYVDIEDTGMGINTHDLEKITLPFWQSSQRSLYTDRIQKKGAGLGLTITQRIIDFMGGELKITSELGKGTRVHFNLYAPQPEASEGSANELEKSAKNYSILLAEDDEDIARLTSTLLELSGCDVDVVGNGKYAISALKQKKYDLLLLDIYMPEMDGYECLRCIREEELDIAVIVMSASILNEEKQKMLELGCSSYLIKPVEISDVLRLANDLVK